MASGLEQSGNDGVRPSPFVLGESEEGRPILVHFLGTEDAALHVLILAGQHGDERRASEAVRWLSSHIQLPGQELRLAFVPEVNPDGAVQRTRYNARGVDLNRDHQALIAAETRCLHRFVRVFRPHLIVDVHTYPPRRRYLQTHGLVHCSEVFFEIPTNPNAACWRGSLDGLLVVQHLTEELAARGYRGGRYVLIRPSGGVRHGTPDVVDARNGLALRFGVPALLVEGRRPLRGELSEERIRLAAALRTALAAIVRWAWEQRHTLTQKAASDSPEAIALKMGYLRAGAPCQLALRDVRTGQVQDVTLPGRYKRDVVVRKSTRPPTAYAVSRTAEALIAMLRRHGFPERCLPHGSSQWVERLRITGLRPSKRPMRAPRALEIEALSELQALDGHVIFPVTDDGGAALAVFLEPESKYALHRVKEAGISLVPGKEYPVLRVKGSEQH